MPQERNPPIPKAHANSRRLSLFGEYVDQLRQESALCTIRPIKVPCYAARTNAQWLCQPVRKPASTSMPSFTLDEPGLRTPSPPNNNFLCTLPKYRYHDYRQKNKLYTDFPELCLGIHSGTALPPAPAYKVLSCLVWHEILPKAASPRNRQG